MTSKKYLAAGIAVILFLAAATIISGGNNQIPPTTGSKDLTREIAAEKIKTYLQNNSGKIGYGRNIKTFYGDGNRKDYYISYTENETKEFVNAGLIENVSWTLETGGPALFSFTEKAKPYLTGKADSIVKSIDVVMAEPVSVEVTGLTKPNKEGLGSNQSGAEFTAKYAPTPFGKIVNEKKYSQNLEGSMNFVLYDDGWRLADYLLIK